MKFITASFLFSLWNWSTMWSALWHLQSSETWNSNYLLNSRISKRVDSINILGVTVTITLTMNEHVDRILSNCAQSVFALKTLRAYGLNRECLHSVFNAVILAKLTYDRFHTCLRERERKKERERERELKHLSVVVNALNCVLQKQKLLQKSATFPTIGYSATLHVIHIISSINYFRQSPQLQKTTISDRVNTIDIFQNVLHVSLMLTTFL